MYTPLPPNLPLKARARYILYGMIAGLLIGIVLGWMFHNAVGFVMTVLFVTPFIVLAVLAMMYWWRTTKEAKSTKAEPYVPDAEWHDVDPRRQTR